VLRKPNVNPLLLSRYTAVALGPTDRLYTVRSDRWLYILGLYQGVPRLAQRLNVLSDSYTNTN
jgi:hypothetical protein